MDREQLNNLIEKLAKLEMVFGIIAQNLDKLIDNQVEKINELLNKLETFTISIGSDIEKGFTDIRNEFDKLKISTSAVLKAKEDSDDEVTKKDQQIINDKDKQIKWLKTILFILAGVIVVLIGLDLMGLISLVGLK